MHHAFAKCTIVSLELLTVGIPYLLRVQIVVIGNSLVAETAVEIGLFVIHTQKEILIPSPQDNSDKF